MSLYRDSDIDELCDHIDDIVKSGDQQRYDKVKPTRKEMWDIIYTVRDFVVEKKRKIYGGFALNKLIESVDARDKFYDDDNIEDWDIDFYSPDPIGDSKEIADRLYAKGFRFVLATEAQHEETYKVFAETLDCADISYVPRNIYNRIPFKIVDGLHLTGPHFMMIDYFRVITDPLTSWHIRLDKTVKRLRLMDKHFSLPHNSSSLDIVPAEDNLDIAFRTVHEFFENRDTIIVLGMYAYNHYVSESGINHQKYTSGSEDQKGGNFKNKHDKKDTKKDKKRDNKGTDIKLVPLNYYEAISTTYKKDSRELIHKLREKFLDSGKLVTHEESYPFFQYIGYSVTIMYDGDVICKLYHYNNRCTPYHKVSSHYFGDKSYSTIGDGGSKIQIGSFPMIILYNLITIMKARADNDNHTKNTYYTMTSHLIEIKNWYLDTNNKTIYDDTLFMDFVDRCKGDMLSQKMEKQIRIQKKMESGQKYTYRYNPERDTDNKTIYRFKNSSGNPIRNDKNYQIDLSPNATNVIDDLVSDLNSEEEIDEHADSDNSVVFKRARSLRD
jgi:hypothetical protein